MLGKCFDVLLRGLNFAGIKFCGFPGFSKNREIKSRRKICNKLSAKLNPHENYWKIRLFYFYFKQTYTVFIRYKWCLFVYAFLRPEKTWFVYLIVFCFFLGVWTFVFLVLESAGTSTAPIDPRNLRKHLDKCHTRNSQNISKWSVAKLNPREGVKILEWSTKFDSLRGTIKPKEK